MHVDTDGTAKLLVLFLRLRRLSHPVDVGQRNISDKVSLNITVFLSAIMQLFKYKKLSPRRTRDILQQPGQKDIFTSQQRQIVHSSSLSYRSRLLNIYHWLNQSHCRLLARPRRYRHLCFKPDWRGGLLIPTVVWLVDQYSSTGLPLFSSVLIDPRELLICPPV